MWQHEVVEAKQQPLVLLVENHPSSAEALSHVLGRNGLRTQAMPTADAALSWARHAHPDLVIIDVGLPPLSGAELVSKLRTQLRDAEVPIIILTVAGPIRESQFGSAADQYLAKPVETDLLIDVVRRRLAEHARTRLVGDALRESLSGLLSRYRAEARARHVPDHKVRVNVALREVLALVEARLEGLRGEDEPDVGGELDWSTDDGDLVDGIEVAPPSVDEIRERLTAMGAACSESAWSST